MKIPSILRCGILILLAKTALRVRGFGWTIRWLGRHMQSVPERPLCHLEPLEAVEQAVAMAGALYPGRARCLEQSLVLYYLLRRQGFAVRFCQGVQAYPFEAHAWVEYAGRPLTDVLEHTKRFAQLASLLP